MKLNEDSDFFLIWNLEIIHNSVFSDLNVPEDSQIILQLWP